MGGRCASARVVSGALELGALLRGAAGRVIVRRRAGRAADGRALAAASPWGGTCMRSTCAIAKKEKKTRTGRAEDVPARVLPHARDELHEATGEDGHADDDVRDGDPARVDVEHREDERCRRERENPAAVRGGGVGGA